MKKTTHTINTLVTLFLALAMSACADPTDTVVPIADQAPEKVSNFKKALEKLSAEDQESLKRYALRAAFANAMGGPTVDVTIKDALENQRNFEAAEKKKADDAAAEEKARAAAEAAERAEHQRRVEALKKAVAVSVVEKSFIPSDWRKGEHSDHIGVGAIFTNNTEKTLTGIKGTITMLDMFGDRVFAFECTVEGEIPPGRKYGWVGAMRYNQFDDELVRFKNADLEKLKTSWAPSMLVFADGTVEKVE